MGSINLLDEVKIEERFVIININSINPFNITTFGVKKKSSPNNPVFKTKNINITSIEDLKGVVKSYSKNYCKAVLHINKDVGDRETIEVLYEKLCSGKGTSRIFYIEDRVYNKWYKTYIDISPILGSCNKSQAEELQKTEVAKPLLLEFADKTKPKGLENIVDNNLYCFLDCEYSSTRMNNKLLVNEIAITYCIIQNKQLKVVAKYYKADQDTLHLCREFIEYEQVFVNELLEYYDLHKAVYVGHGVKEDLYYIYLTAHTPYIERVLIETHKADWLEDWSLHALCEHRGYRLSDLALAYELKQSEISATVYSIYSMKSTTYHNAAFDSITLIILVNILLMKKYKLEDLKTYIESRQE